MPISINDIQKIENSRREIKKDIYKKIYEQFSKKIKTVVELGHKQIFLRIPQFLIGFPSYDVVKAGNYIQRQYDNSGFIVHRTSPIDLYVSWDTSGKKTKPAKPAYEYDSFDDPSLPSLINLKKLASKYKNA